MSEPPKIQITGEDLSWADEWFDGPDKMIRCPKCPAVGDDISWTMFVGAHGDRATSWECVRCKRCGHKTENPGRQRPDVGDEVGTDTAVPPPADLLRKMKKRNR